MATTKHSSLGPSKSERWLKCRASVGFIAKHAKRIPQEPPSPYAEEGKLAHGLAEKLLRGSKVDLKKYPSEMVEHCEGYAKFVRNQMGMMSNPKLFVEQTIPLYYDSKQVGTADAFICGSKYVLVDLKYGAGVSVEAKRNSQLAIYFKSQVKKQGLKLKRSDPCLLVIYQPRAQDNRFVRKWETTWGELEEFCAAIADTAMDILADPDNQPFFCEPETVCRWCPAKIICPTYAGHLLGEVPAGVEASLELVPVGDESLSARKADGGFPAADTLTDDQIARLIGVAGDLKDWLTSIVEHAQARHDAGDPVPGTKVVEGRGSRQWEDERKAAKVLRRLLPKDYMVSELISPAQAEKALKKRKVKRGEDKLAALIEHKPGKPTLVHESDPRPALALLTAGNSKRNKAEEAALL